MEATVVKHGRIPHANLRYTGSRLTIRNWLVEHGMTQDAADRWCDAWEAEAEARELHPLDVDFWHGAAAWIVEQRTARKTQD